ncbi:MAG: peptide-methionine (R)-S-oxide reductase, partial [Candidatus Thiodiazotropha sp.]
MKRRSLIKLLGAAALLPVVGQSVLARQDDRAMQNEKIDLTDAQWRERLTPEQYHILREEGTERPGTSHLLKEKREGVY